MKKEQTSSHGLQVRSSHSAPVNTASSRASMDCGKQQRWSVIGLTIAFLLIGGCDRRPARPDGESIFIAAVSALEHSSARPSDKSRKVQSLMVARDIPQSVIADAARVRPTEVARSSRLDRGEVLIKEFRTEGRRAHLLMLIGPANPFPATGTVPNCGQTETMTFKKGWSGKWVLDTREQMMC